MPLTLDGSLPIEPMTTYPPHGVPLGQNAMIVKLSPETLEALQRVFDAELAITASANTAPKHGTNRHNSEKRRREETATMELIVGDSGQEFVIDGKRFNVDATRENAPHEIYVRHQSPSPAHPGLPAGSPSDSLRLIAHVDGKLSVVRELTESARGGIRERTAHYEESNRHTAIILDPAEMERVQKTAKKSGRSHHSKTSSSSSTKHSVPARHSPPQTTQAPTPPKSDGSPALSSVSNFGMQHTIPDGFSSLDLTIPTNWHGPISLPIRIIHELAERPLTEKELLDKLNPGSERAAALSALRVLTKAGSDSEGRLVLRDEACYYVRPWEWLHYGTLVRPAVVKNVRPALRRLGYRDDHQVYEAMRRPPIGWVDPWYSTPEGSEYKREQDAKKAAVAQAKQEDFERRKAAAELNPAATLTGSRPQGFFSAPAKPKKAGTSKSKEKTEKVPKEKVAKRKVDTAATTAETPTKIATTSTGTSTPVYVDSRVRSYGPGSDEGKIAAANRVKREEDRRVAIANGTASPLSDVLLPSLSDSKKRKLPESAAAAVEKPTKKRKLDPASSLAVDDRSATPTPAPKKRKANEADLLPSKPQKASAREQGSSLGLKNTTKPQASSSRPSPAVKTVVAKKQAPRTGDDFDPYTDYEDDAPAPKAKKRHVETKAGKPTRESEGGGLSQQATKRLSRSASSTTASSSSSNPPLTIAERIISNSAGGGGVNQSNYWEHYAEYRKIYQALLEINTLVEQAKPGDDAGNIPTADDIRLLVERMDSLAQELRLH